MSGGQKHYGKDKPKFSLRIELQAAAGGDRLAVGENGVAKNQLL
jgi:hypothetical protein